MPVTIDGKMTAPLGVKAVANYFGVSTDVFSACTAGAINKWAKHKPIALASMGLVDTPVSLRADQKKAANYGLTYKSAVAADDSELPTAIAEVCGENGMWTYTKPVANFDWARLDDFLNPDGWADKTGYDPDATAPCVSSNIETTFRTTNVGAVLDVFLTGRDAASYPGQLHFNEMGIFDEALGRSYLCLAFKYGSTWYYIFSSDTFDNVVKGNGGGWGDTAPWADLPVITDPLFTPFGSIPSGSTRNFTGFLFLIDLYDAYSGDVPDKYKGACLSQSEIDNNSYMVYSLPFPDMKYANGTFKVYNPSSASALEYNYTFYVESSDVKVVVTVTNGTNLQRTINNLFVYLMAYDTYENGGVEDLVEQYAITDWLGTGYIAPTGIEMSGSYGWGVYAAIGKAINGGQTIAAGETKTYTITFNGVEDEFGNPYDLNAKIYGCAEDSLSGRTTF